MDFHDCCDTKTCHRTAVNPYCSATVRVRCDCGAIKNVKGIHFCMKEEE